MEPGHLKNILEAVLLSTDRPLRVPEIDALFAGDNDAPTRDEIRKALHDLGEDYFERGFELVEVASGFRLQVKQDYATWVGRLWDEKPARYSRALLETIALIAYRQPITRGEIEEVRGVSVSSNIIKTLLEREWIKVLGHKDVPGRPALYGTAKEFLDYFNLKSLDELPTLAEIRDLDQIHPELGFDEGVEAANDESAVDEFGEAVSPEAPEEPSDARQSDMEPMQAADDEQAAGQLDHGEAEAIADDEMDEHVAQTEADDDMFGETDAEARSLSGV
jgi:segregation and condensation protein B